MANRFNRNDRSTWGTRDDGSQKGSGYFGLLDRPDGDVSTELSVGIEIDGKETQIPLLVPTLTADELTFILNNDDIRKIPESIFKKAKEHAVQRMNKGLPVFAQEGEAGSLPKGYKPKADTSWVTDDLLDALAMAESSMDPYAVNENSFAAGMYQWMPAYWADGKEIGFGVDSGAFDPYDPKESRKRTKQYLEGMQKYYPDWDPSEVLMAYNWGHSNVRDLKSGKLDLEEYMADNKWNKNKVSEAMNYAPKIFKYLEEKPWMANLDETGLESTIE